MTGTIFEHAGLICKTLKTSMGHWCGYVALPESHRLHGVKYSDKIEVPKEVRERLIDVDKVGVINLFCADVKEGDTALDFVLAVDVHGGLTFSGKQQEDDFWWVGFDCAHCTDARSPEEETGDQIYRDEEYVIAECRSLAEQLVSLGEAA